jgi:lambda family phage portal protein
MNLRDISRQLERNHPTARAGVEALKALIVGTGIALAPETGDQGDDDSMRAMFDRWSATCGVNGESLFDLQRLACADMVVAGEIIWRLVPTPEKFLGISIQALDAEWLADNGTVPGIDLDKYGRPVTYYLRNPDGTQETEAVPAAFILHIFEPRRSLQARGEPWLAPVIERLSQENDLVIAELTAAKNTAAVSLAVTQAGIPTGDEEDDADGEKVIKVDAGSIIRTAPGEDVKVIQNTRPSQQIAPFRKMLAGDIAAALRIPARFLDRDVSRANFSSMRADMIDTERLMAPSREWFGKITIGALYVRLFDRLTAAAGVRADAPKAYRLLPDETPYVDPQKDIAASKAAIDAGLSTAEQEVSRRGGDYQKTVEQRRREMQAQDADTVARIQQIQADVDRLNKADPSLGLHWSHVVALSGPTPISYSPVKTDAAPEDQEDEQEDEEGEAEEAEQQGQDDMEEGRQIEFVTDKATGKLIGLRSIK